MKSQIAIPLGMAALLSSATAFAQHTHEGDVLLGIQESRIVTGIMHDDGPEFEVRVFGAEFGEDPNLPGNVSEEPGFDNLPGTFAVGSAIGFNFLGQLLQWNGSSFAPSSHTMTFLKSVGSDVLERTTSTGFVPGFTLDVDATGEWHEHYGMRLNPIGGNADPGVGVYALRLNLFSTQTALNASKEFWFVFNYEDTEENHDAAIDYANSVVPEPATMLALASGLAALAFRRKR